MCGIAGIVSNNPSLVQQPMLKLMANALQHRGPDGEGFFINEQQQVGFAHRRLSVIDLSNDAAQPMHYLGRYTITYNGEIYNYLELKLTLQQKGYKFKSASDTEVILAAYDCYQHQCLQYFDGMFAFAIWDNQTNQLFAARDRFGEKPFYYFIDNEEFVFASEMKALWANGIDKSINNTQLLNYLSHGFVSNPTSGETTFYNNILKLPVASYLYYSLATKQLNIERYWDIDKESKTALTNIHEIQEKFVELLQQSVSRRLRSDISLGTSLSGGLDSSSILAIISKLNNSNSELKTFSATFPGFEKDESKYIREVVAKFGIGNETTTPTATDFINDFEKLLYHQEEPFQSSSIYAQYKVYELAKQHGVTVLLDGQGADETLAGYTKYYHYYWQQLITEKKFTTLRSEIQQTKQHEINIAWGIKNYAAALMPAISSKQLEKNVWQKQQLHPFLQRHFIETFSNKQTIYKPSVEKLNDILYFDTMQLGLEDLLRYADRNSMAHGREVRLPFLNHELITFIFSLPASMKIQNGFTKHLLRLSMNNLLPSSIVWRTDKIGFEPPQAQWMQHPETVAFTQAAKQKLVANGFLKKEILAQPLQPISAHAGNNLDWWCLCAGGLMG
jgi:asparagine synthase (glutamine-hydrolysing)